MCVHGSYGDVMPDGCCVCACVLIGDIVSVVCSK